MLKIWWLNEYLIIEIQIQSSILNDWLKLRFYPNNQFVSAKAISTFKADEIYWPHWCLSAVYNTKNVFFGLKMNHAWGDHFESICYVAIS